jgi:hypothetical protein
MKRSVFLVLTIIFTVSLSYAIILDITPDDINTDIANAIKAGDAAKLATYFNSTIDLTVPDNDGTFSKAQAELIVKDFFSKNPPKSFVVNHSGSSNDGSLFSVGTYISGSKSYRTYFLVKKTTATFSIQQLQFELQ